MVSIRSNWVRLRSILSLSVVFLFIEFFDELLYAVETAALPAIRADLNLTYGQIGILLGLPSILNVFIEPVLMLLGDTGLRKRLVVGGGLVMMASVLFIAAAHSFAALLIALIAIHPASGAFVSLSQATLVDLRPGREAHSLARWTVSGSLGNLTGPLLLAAGLGLGLGWRPVYALLAGFALLLVLVVKHFPFPAHQHAINQPEAARLHSIPTLTRDLRSNLSQALRNRSLLRWVILLDLSDLLLDVFTGFTALYLTDVVGAPPAQASLVVGLLMLSGLLADLALVPLLERFPGRTLVRRSAAAALIIYPALLLAPWPSVKVLLLVSLRFTTLGWYSVLKGEAYAAAPGKSGTVEALSSVSGLLTGVFPWLVGWLAGLVGLQPALWVLLLGPLALAIFVPAPEQAARRVEDRAA